MAVPQPGRAKAKAAGGELPPCKGADAAKLSAMTGRTPMGIPRFHDPRIAEEAFRSRKGKSRILGAMADTPVRMAVSRGVSAAFFDALRAGGVTWLAAPRDARNQPVALVLGPDRKPSADARAWQRHSLVLNSPSRPWVAYLPSTSIVIPARAPSPASAPISGAV